MKNSTSKKITLVLSVFVVSLLFLSSADESKAVTFVCDDSAGIANTNVDSCPVPTDPVSCTDFDTIPDAVCPTGWECSTPACLAECNYNLGVRCSLPGLVPGPQCTTNAPTVCGCTCPGGGGGGGGTTIGCIGGIPDDICASGETMFNCTADCLPAGVPNRLIPDVIDDAIVWLLGFAVAISVLALVYGGTCYVFSSGDMQKTENAKKIIKYSLIGIFIAGISFAIVTIIDTVFH